MECSEPSINIENIVGSTSINQEIDLNEIALDLRYAEYDPENFPGIHYSVQDTDTLVTIFRSGDLVCTGANSIESIHDSLHIILDKLSNLNIAIGDPEIQIHNIVASVDLGLQLNLSAIAVGFGLENVEYEPEQYSGLVYQLEHPDVVVLLYANGKAIIVGATDPADTTEAVNTVISRLKDLGLYDP